MPIHAIVTRLFVCVNNRSLDWIPGLLYRNKFMPSTLLWLKLMPCEVIDPTWEPTVVFLTCHIVKLPSKYVCL